VYSWLDCDSEISLNIKCVTSDPIYKLIQSEIREDRGSVSESSALELKLDIDELQELYTMCTRPSVKTFISQLINQLETVCNEIPYCHESNPKEKRKWSDIVAGRNPHVPGTNSAITHNIATVITSRPSYYCGVLCRAEASGIVYPSTVKKNSMKHQDSRSRIVILGDSHARGVAGELLHQSKDRLNTTGYVKPKAGLTELLNTAKNDLSKLTKTDTLIVIGGSNDIDGSDQGKRLTSTVNFLYSTQNTNVILVEVPVRYDSEARSHINEQIENYNKKLVKVTKVLSM
jgi:hypothetical protein